MLWINCSLLVCPKNAVTWIIVIGSFHVCSYMNCHCQLDSMSVVMCIVTGRFHVCGNMDCNLYVDFMAVVIRLLLVGSTSVVIWTVIVS